jgi:hypothetical protein
MARFRKIDTRIWNDEKFMELANQEKLIFLFLLTHPHMTSLGAMRGSIAGFAAELRNQPETVSKGFGILFRKGFLEHDEKACFLALPNFLKYNSPENPNVVKSWESILDLLPECDLKLTLIARVKHFLETSPEPALNGMANRFETSPKPARNPEPEPEPYKEQEPERAGGSGSSSGSRPSNDEISTDKKTTPTHTPASAFFLTDELRSWAEAAAPDIDPEIETEKFRDYYGRNGKTFADLPAAWRKWIRDAVERQNRARAPTARRESRGERNERIIREIEAEDRAKAADEHGGQSL